MEIPLTIFQLFLLLFLHITKFPKFGFYVATMTINGGAVLGSKLTSNVGPSSGQGIGMAISSTSGVASHLNSPTAVVNKPYFDDISPRNITSIVDETAILKCRVRNKGDRTVSWMRKRDLHILTSNIYTYTGDQRFSVIHPPDSEDWDLKIEYVQPRDSGIYECQVNTEPKINLAIQLGVTDRDIMGAHYGLSNSDMKAARAKIIGSQELHVKKGSTISLSCSVNIHASAIAWYHGSSIVDFDSVRGGISLETEKTESGTTSRLMLTRAALRDSGNYSCVPLGAISASVQVHVLNGEHPAAMQTSSSGPCPSQTALIFLSIFTIYCAHRPIISELLEGVFFSGTKLFASR